MDRLKTFRDPIGVHGRAPELWATGTTKPWLGRPPPACRERRGGDAAPDTKPEDSVDRGSEPNKRPRMR